MAKATVKENEKNIENVKAEVLPAEATADSVEPEEEKSAPAAAKDERVEVVLPRFMFTQDTNSTHHEVCVNGKICQIQYDVPVKVPPMVAEVVNNAIEQSKKVTALIKGLDGKAKELTV